jgi:hypothetical protein
MKFAKFFEDLLVLLYYVCVFHYRIYVFAQQSNMINLIIEIMQDFEWRHLERHELRFHLKRSYVVITYENVSSRIVRVISHILLHIV